MLTRTTPITRFVVGLAAAGLALGGLTACGGQSLAEAEEGSGGSGGNTSFAEPAPISDEELAKSVLEQIEPDEKLAAQVPEKMRKSGLRATTSVGYPPMEEWASNGTDIVGIDPAMAHAISRKLGLNLSLEDQEFNAMIPGLISGRFDVLLSSMTDNEERRETTTFVDYVQAGNAFLVAEGNPEKIKVPMDLCGKTIAVVESGSSALIAQDFSAECEAEGKPGYEILSLSGDGEANLAVQSGRAVATVTDFPVAVERAKNPETQMDAVRIDGDESIWGIGVDNSQKELAKTVQAALQSLMDDGSYKKILDAYGVGDMALEKATINGGA